MTRLPRTARVRVAWAAVLLAAVSPCHGEEPPTTASGIPGKAIATLREELAEAGEASSSSRMRRAWKGVVRDGTKLLETSPSAPNRFRVLEIMFEARKRLLGLENSGENREALLATCEMLAEAPDEYAELRLEADMLLSERELSARNADVQARVQALTELIARYRDTPGESKSLMMAALIAPKLEAFDLEKAILRTLGGRFAGDHDVIEWRRKHRDFSHLPVQFTGAFERSDGAVLSFPVDRMGRTSVVYFWSKDTPGVGEVLDRVKDLQARFPGHFEVFSFNVDELPDAGEGFLRARGLDWTALRLPGGRDSQVYRVYAGGDPLGVRVNAHGHAHVSAHQIRTLAEETPMEQNLDDPRYLAQLQSLLVGDFLAPGVAPGDQPARPAESVPAETLDAIRSCFVPPPFRYRLTAAEARAHYEEAERLCRETIAKHPAAPGLWRARNRRIIALLGMWMLATEPKHLRAAVEEARAALAAGGPPEAQLVPRFCLAKDALRAGDSDPRAVLTGLVEASGGNDAPASAYAAAAILAIDANYRDLHAHYRGKVLASPDHDPALWPVVTFLRDQNHRYRLFKPNFYHPPSLARRIERANLRSNAAAFEASGDAGGPLQAEFDTLDGGRLALPQATGGMLTLLLFVEPPGDPAAAFPTAINGAVTEDSRGRKVETPGVMQRAFGLADEHVDKGLKVITAVLDEDAERVRALVGRLQWPCETVMVPGGLGNPLVQRLGILSADRVPNVFLLRPDGTVAWKLSGLVHPQVRSEGIGETLHVIERAMKTNIERVEASPLNRMKESP